MRFPPTWKVLYSLATMSKARIIDAVKTLDLKTTKSLLQARPELLKVTDRRGWTLLHFACSNRNKDKAAVPMVEFLLDQGLEIESPIGKDDVTVLFFAVARARSATLVKLLLQRGAKATNAPGGGLFAAGWWGDVEILDILIRAGSKIDVVVGITPFLACFIWKQFEAAKFLATNGANVDFQEPRSGRTAMHVAVEKEFDPALIRWLVEHGASPDIPDKKGITARSRASRKRDKRFFRALGFAQKNPLLEKEG